MSRTWDIAEGIFSTNALITQPQPSSRRPAAEVSSMVQFAVVVGLASGALASTSTVIQPLGVDRASEMRIILKRLPLSLRRPPERQRREGIDFVRGRSAEQLANSFRGYFKPSNDIDDSPDEGFVFD